ncbi:MAG: monofunctional biosynthetic peptidoglycan transglycosylase [Chitinophagaceae bacterium]|nr:monofunctional biosynthetic peptidoglycan transglycosylase [Chitinophagaceae bacterium]
MLKRILRLLLWLWVFDLAYVVITKWINPPITITMIESLITGHGLTRDYISFDAMGKQAPLAVISAEDQLFATHGGVDWVAIHKALKYNNNPTHKKVRGGSTISQQTAKNVFLWQQRSWLRKGLELYHTYLIEWIWGKQRILETYLNVAEMGEGIFGIEAAAQHYYHKSAKQLSSAEAASIAACLPNPKRFKPTQGSRYIARRKNWILKQMGHLKQEPNTRKLLQFSTEKK